MDLKTLIAGTAVFLCTLTMWSILLFEVFLFYYFAFETKECKDTYTAYLQAVAYAIQHHVPLDSSHPQPFFFYNLFNVTVDKPKVEIKYNPAFQKNIS